MEPPQSMGYQAYVNYLIDNEAEKQVLTTANLK